SVRFVHGGVDSINRFVFASARDAIAEELRRAKADVVVAGHAGIPFIERGEAGIWFNPGVIGMPANDGTPAGWDGLIQRDGANLLLSTHRMSYDHHAAAAAMRRCAHA